MAPGQVSDQCQIVLGANLANLGPYPFGRTLWKRGVQHATKHMRISCWGPVWDRFRSTYNSAGQVPRAFSVRGTVSRRCESLLQFLSKSMFAVLQRFSRYSLAENMDSLGLLQQVQILRHNPNRGACSKVSYASRALEGVVRVAGPPKKGVVCNPTPRPVIRLTPVLTTCTSFSNSGLSGIFTVFTYEIGFRGLRQTRYTSLPAFL